MSNLICIKIDFKTQIMDKLPPPCQCENCYHSDNGDSSVDNCQRGKEIHKQWDEYYMKRRFEDELRIEREILEFVISQEELKAKEIEKKKARMVREGKDYLQEIKKEEEERKKKVAYDFWYYALLFILSYEFLKKLIMYKLSTIY